MRPSGVDDQQELHHLGCLEELDLAALLEHHLACFAARVPSPPANLPRTSYWSSTSRQRDRSAATAMMFHLRARGLSESLPQRSPRNREGALCDHGQTTSNKEWSRKCVTFVMGAVCNVPSLEFLTISVARPNVHNLDREVCGCNGERLEHDLRHAR